VLDYCQVSRFSKKLEDSAQRKMHHLPLGTRLHRNISQGGGKRPGDGCPGFLSKMGVTIFTGTQILWDGKRYLGPATQIELQNFAPCVVVCIYIKSWSRVWHAPLDMYIIMHTRETHTYTGWYPASSMTTKCGSTTKNTVWSTSTLWMPTCGCQRRLLVRDEGAAYTQAHTSEKKIKYIETSHLARFE